MFIDGFQLPQFACYPLLRSERGREALQRYYDSYLAIAASDGRGIVLQAPTWRASSHWGDLLGPSVSDLAELNRDGRGDGEDGDGQDTGRRRASCGRIRVCRSGWRRLRRQWGNDFRCCAPLPRSTDRCP